MVLTNSKTHRVRGKIPFYLSVALLFLAGCGSENSGNISKDSMPEKEKVQVAGVSIDRPDMTSICTVEITRAEYEEIKGKITGGGMQRKLIFQLLMSKPSESAKLFDLAVYGAKNHNDYAQNSEPTIAKAVNPHLRIDPQKDYYLGNNEITIAEIENMVQGLNWTKLVLTPELAANGHLIYKIQPYEGTTPLKDQKQLLRSRDTNPSPPAVPSGV